MKKYKAVGIIKVSEYPLKYTVSVNWRNPIIKFITDNLDEAIIKAKELRADDGEIYSLH